MHFSTVLSAAALLAACNVAAAPLKERAYVVVTDYVTKVTYITCTEEGYVTPTPPVYSTHEAKPTPYVGYSVYTSVYEVVEATTPPTYVVYTEAPAPVYTPPTEVYTEAPAPVYTPPAAAYTPKSTPVASSGSSGYGSVADEIVNAHNTYRAMHGAGPLTWSPTLADWGTENSADCAFEHTSPYKYGENLAQGTDLTPSQAVDMWYNEISSYDWSNPGFTDTTGHFTQVVWLATTEIGCGWQPDCSGGAYLKCEYNTPGNYDGEFAANVLQG